MIRKPCRFLFRAVWFGAELILFFLHYLLLVARHQGLPPRSERARWLSWCSRRTLRAVAVEFQSSGPVPHAGMLVANHLSYLDILIVSALTPTVFVAKSEVKNWPIFGWCGTLAGTLYVRRTLKGDVARVGNEIEAVLNEGHLLAFFPEGTSSDGHQVLPFKSSLLEPVAGKKHPLTAACFQYSLADGSVEDDVCYWRDMTLAPHLAKLMTKKRIEGRVRFSEVREASPDRKELARQLHAEVTRLLGEMRAAK